MSHDTPPSSRAANTGRHRNNGTGTWTPAIPAQSHEGHGAHEITPAENEGADIPTQGGEPRGRLSGVLPAATPQPTASREAEPPEPDDSPTTLIPAEGVLSSTPSERRDPPHGAERQQRRTRVSFTHPEMRPASVESEEDEQEEEPAPSGLGVFELGSVPASVTPPKTWRRAAWFAAVSSGGVMVLLFAGSFLLGQPPTQPGTTDEWAYLNRRAMAPLMERDERFGGSDSPTSRVPAGGGSSLVRSSTAPVGDTGVPGSGDSARNVPLPPAASASGSAAATEPTSRVPRTTSRPSPPLSTTATPEKPPPTPAETTVVNQRPFYAQQLDVREMAQRSQTYFNTVTENPARAHELTAGKLEAKGAEGLRRKYAEVAYFEVRKVTVNEGKGVTVNTVRTVYEDGHAEIQRRTLAFNADSEITKASR